MGKTTFYLQKLEFPKPDFSTTEKKKVDYLYIDADKDHVALQFREKKGDLLENSRYQKNNHAITKLIYVYEGIETESPRSKRRVLPNPYYFCGDCDGIENQELWEEVYTYIESRYDLSEIKHIYLNADGGKWILAGKEKIAESIYVCDSKSTFSKRRRSDRK